MNGFGALRTSEEITTSISGARAWKVTYSSADVGDRPTTVTGLVIAPAAAGADRPVLTWSHGTTGLGDASCPSAQPDPASELITYFDAGSTRQIDHGVPALQQMIDAGWVVCATDYQGLGTEGMHQYTVGVTQARDSIAIVHAARALNIGAGTKVGCMGWSQGGGTAAAVAELDAADYGDLQLLGTVPMSPGLASVVLSLPGIEQGVFNPKAPVDPHIVMTFAGHAAAFPSLNLGDLLTPLGVEIVDKGWNVQPVHHLGDALNRLARLRGPIFREDPQNFQAWVDASKRGSACRIKPIAPVLLCMDTFDNGTVVSVDWQQAYRQQTEALGAQVTVREYPKDDHFSLPTSCAPDGFAWLQELAAR